MKPTINIFYLKFIIFENIISQKMKIFDFYQVEKLLYFKMEGVRSR
jgi:hypothetical protein